MKEVAAMSLLLAPPSQTVITTDVLACNAPFPAESAYAESFITHRQCMSPYTCLTIHANAIIDGKFQRVWTSNICQLMVEKDTSAS